MRPLSAMCAVVTVALAGTVCRAQAVPTPARDRGTTLQVAVTGIALRSLASGTGASFGQGGGTVSVAYRVFRGYHAHDGVGVVADLMGTHTGSAGSSGTPLSVVSTTFGPRYTAALSNRVQVFGQGLVGVANGFGGRFPTATAVNSSASSLAVQAGVGLDVAFNHRFALRALDAAYVRTGLPNAQSNVQNSFRIGAGLVLNFR